MKAELKTKPSDQDVQQFIQAMPDGRRQVIEQLHQLIVETLPNQDVKLWGKILGYGDYHYKYKSGREGDWFPVGLANGAQYMSLYICAVKDGQYLAEANKEKLGKVSVGKSCIRFKKLEDLNLDVVRQLVKDAPAYAASN